MRIHNEEYFPADMVFIQSSERKGFCYVETKNLDGETNLKTKYVNRSLNSVMNSLVDYSSISGTIACDHPND